MHDGSPMFPRRPAEQIIVIDIFRGSSPTELSGEQLAVVYRFESQLACTEEIGNNGNFPHTEYYLQFVQARYGEAMPGIEEVWRIKINSVTFGLKYFTTDEGQEAFSQALGQELVSFDTTKEAASVLVSADMTPPERSNAISDLAGDSIKFEEAQLVEAFAERGYGSTEGLQPLEVLTVIKNPEQIAVKASLLRSLKGYYKAVEKDLRRQNEDQSVTAAKQLLVRLYCERVNQMMAELYSSAYNLMYAYELHDSEVLHEQLVAIEQVLPGFKWQPRSRMSPGSQRAHASIARGLQRFDRYLHGVTVEREGSTGDVRMNVIGGEVLRLADQDHDSEAGKTVDRGTYTDLDSERLAQTELTAGIRVTWAEKILADRGILSDFTEYDVDRRGPAPDDKWQAVTRKEFKVHAVNARQKVSKIPELLEEPTITRVVPIMDHENNGHVVQHLLKESLGFEITKNVGFDGAVYHAEAGPKALEKRTREVLTGKPDTDVAGTGYLRATQARLAGGDYLDCMKAYFDDYRRRYPEESMKRAAQIAVNRARRIFRSGGKFAEGTTYLTNSQPLNYLEGEQLTRALPEELRYLLLVGGVNLNKLAVLYQHGLVDLTRFQQAGKSVLEILESDIRDLVASHPE